MKNVTPITAANLPRWALRTVRQDFEHYRSRARPLTLERIRKSLWPVLERPLFIIGAPRSGTSLLGRCLGALPELSYHFEPAVTKAAARHVYRGDWTFEEAARFYRRVYGWLLRVHLDGDRRFAEKTPRNCFLVNFLRQAFPGAQFVHILRDGRDAALSHSKKPWLQAAAAESGERGTSGAAFGVHPRFWVEPERVEAFRTTTDFHRCIWAWRRHVEGARRAAQALPPGDYYELRYEAFVQAPEAEGERLLDALGIAQPGSRERFLDAAREAHAQSVGAWREALTRQQRRCAEEEAGDLLRTLGYLQQHAAVTSV